MPYQLQECLDSLREIRFKLHRETDPGILAEFDEVLAALDVSLQKVENKEIPPKVAVDDALALVGRVVELIANVAEIVSKLSN